MFRSLMTVNPPKWALLLLLTALPGCADMLGLDGLTYDRGSEEDPDQLDPADDPQDDPVLGSGGTISVDEDDDFPLTVATNAVILAGPEEASNSRFWVYSPDAATLSAFQLDPDGPDVLGEQEHPSAGPFSHFAAFPTSEGDHLLFSYGADSGAVAVVAEADGHGPLAIRDEDVGTTGRTDLLAFPWNGKWLALVATADDGHHRYFNPDPNAGMDVVAGIWDPGHTSIAPFEFGGDEGLLLLHPEEGVLRFARFTEYGQPFDVIFEVPVPFEATHVRSFESEGVSTVVLYDAVTGTIETGRFGEVEEGVGYFPRETRVTQERLTELVPVTYDGVPHALTLSAETGVLHLRSLDPLEDSPIIVK